MELMFRARSSKAPGMTALEMAIQNYKLMMGKSELTPMEEEILKMMIERQELGHALNKKPGCLRFRKAWFFMRNLNRVNYQTLDGSKTARMLVSPLTFLFQVFSASSFSQAYDHYRTLHLRQLVEDEFEKCKPLDQKTLKQLEEAKIKEDPESETVTLNESFVLQVDMPESGIDLDRFGIVKNGVTDVSKLDFTVQVCMVGKPAR
jgi:hypothetical protein